MWLFQIRILVETSPILEECVAFPWSQYKMARLFLGASYSSVSYPLSLLRKNIFHAIVRSMNATFTIGPKEWKRAGQ